MADHECVASCDRGLIPQRAAARKGERWPPIESNPEVMTRLAHKLGLPEGRHAFTDVWGLDPELLGMVPAGVATVILLFPSGRKVPYDATKAPASEVMDGSFFLHQVEELDDACGTIAIVHSLTNNQALLGVASDSVVGTYSASLRSSPPLARGEALAANKEISALHSSFAEQGQTEVPPDGTSSGHHFVCFALVAGRVLELDGCKPLPTDYGTPEEILKDEAPHTPHNILYAAAKVIRTHYIEANPDANDFSVIALTTVSSDE